MGDGADKFIVERPRGRAPNIVRPTLDAVDRAIIDELSADARLPNNALAERVGIAPSTCLGRVRALRQSGVIRGFHADVDPELTGRPIQAMVQVRMQSHARGQLQQFMVAVSSCPACATPTCSAARTTSSSTSPHRTPTRCGSS